MDNEKVILQPASDYFKDVPKWKLFIWDIEYYIIDFFWKVKMIILRKPYK